MAGKYDTGSYNLTTFDRRGAKIEKIALGNVGLMQAQQAGRELVKADAVASFVVERVAYNSLDMDEAWLPRATGRFSDGKPYSEDSK